MAREFDMVVIEWRLASPTYADIHEFIRSHYRGPYALGRRTQTSNHGSMQILRFRGTARSLSNRLNDQVICGRPVFAYPSTSFS